jgi:hypothetical protein
MKKKSIQKLRLKKTAVSKLNANAISGGTFGNTEICLSVNFCETIDYTACIVAGGLCEIYTEPQR